MRIIFDQGTPVPLRPHLSGHTVSTAFELGWATLTNGDLLAAAEGKFDLLLTTDQNVRYQQNLSNRTLTILVLPTTSWPEIRNHIHEIAVAISSIEPGGYGEGKTYIRSSPVRPQALRCAACRAASRSGCSKASAN